MEDVFEIIGIQLHNEDVSRYMARLEEQGWPAFVTIEEVSADMLFAAAADGHLKEVLGSIDYAFPSETCILWAVGERTQQRVKEIDEHEFYYNLMQYVEKHQKTVFLLGASREELEDTRAGICRDFPECRIVGAEALEDYAERTEAVVNRINGETPDMILSILPTPEQEYFLRENKSMLCVNLWYGIGRIRRNRRQRGFFALMRHYLAVYRLRNLITAEQRRSKQEGRS